MEKIFQLYINHGSGQSYSMLQLSEMQLKSSMKTPQNHFDSKCMIKETTLGMVVDGQWMIMFGIQIYFEETPERHLPHKKEEVCD